MVPAGISQAGAQPRLARFQIFLAATVGERTHLCIGRIADIRSRQPSADELLVLHDGFQCRKKIIEDIRLHDVTPRACANTQCFLHYCRTLVLTDKQNFRASRCSADLPGSLYAIDLGQTNVQQNQVGLQFCTFMDRFQPICSRTASSSTPSAGVCSYREDADRSTRLGQIAIVDTLPRTSAS